jgi:CRISPR-associated Csx2 family protein
MGGYTLISCIGTGQVENGEYKRTGYLFPDSNTYTASFFLGALIKSKRYEPVKEIILVGTVTSHWHLVFDDLIAANEVQEYSDLKNKIENECKSKEGISQDLLDKLGEILIEKLNISVSIIAHTAEIDANTVPEIFESYNELIAQIDSDTDILLDITHGFRSMPLLVYQALQFGFAGQRRRRVELVYGDLRRDTPSIARNLSEYWRLSALTEAKNLFVNKFDGKLLAELLQKEWGEGNILVSRFATLVECNFSLEIPRWIEDAKKAVERPPKGIETPIVIELRDIISGIIKEIDHPYASDTLLAYSRLLENKALYVQAIITLQAAIETRIIEANGMIVEVGYYQKWKKYKQNYEDVIRNLSILSNMYDIRDMRNKIAHGGTWDNDRKGVGVLDYTPLGRHD